MSQAGGFDKSFKAGADLNTTTTQWRPAYINSGSSVNIANTSTLIAVGVIQNKPKTGTGSSVWVRSVGFTKLYMNDTCSAGDTIVTGSGGAVRGTGLSITAATSRFVIGRAIEASAATGTIIELFLNPQTLAGTLGAAID